MHLRFEFAAGPRVLRGILEGVLDDDAMRHAYEQVKRYVRATEPEAGIWDMTGVTEFAVSPGTIRDIGRTPPAFGPVTAPRFIVAPSDLAFGMARIFQAVGDESRPHLQVVRSLEEVYEQLKIAPPKYEPVPPPAD